MGNAAARLRVDCDLAYTLIERLPNGDVLREEFPALDDDDAVDRVVAVIDGGRAELWHGPVLVRAWKPVLKAADADVLRHAIHAVGWMIASADHG